MRSFSEIWSAATAESTLSPQGAAGELMVALAEVLEVEQIEFANIPPAIFFLVDLSSLGFKGMDLNVVMVSRAPKDEVDARKQADLLGEYKRAVESFGFCFVIQLQLEPSKENPHMTSWLEPVFLCGRDIERLFNSEKPSAALFDIIRRQVRVERMCPFNTTQAARSDTFRGRRKELERLTQDLDTPFLISGGRRIGKTSLLKRAYHTLRIHPRYRRSSSQQETVFYFDCLTWQNELDCYIRLAHVIDPRRELRIDKGSRNITYMLQRRSFSGQRPLLLFFDEMDGIVEADARAGWPFFRLLAEAVGERWVRVVFAGYRAMHRLMVQENKVQSESNFAIQTPFHWKLHPLVLGPLSHHETLALFREPFQRVGVSIRDEPSTERRVWQGTMGNPWLVQFYGEEIYQRASIREPQEVCLEDLDDVESGFALGDLLVTHYLQNTMENGREMHFERLCALRFAHQNDTQSWTEGDFLASCRAFGSRITVDQVHSALRNLVNSGLFNYAHDRYAFALPIIKRKLQITYPDLSVIFLDMQQMEKEP